MCLICGWIYNEADGDPEHGITAGTAWADASLLDALGLKLGQTLLMGDASFRLTRIIVQEPDRGAGFISFSPRAMINQSDVAATKLIQPASRTSYRFAVAGPDKTVAEFTAWAREEINKPFEQLVVKPARFLWVDPIGSH